MKNSKKRKVILMSLFLIMLLGISISYSLLISKLDIGGSGKISKNSWDIYFENINIKEGSVNGNIDSITETGLKFDILLNKPGDYFVFSVDVVNGGSLDAMVENFKLSDISNYASIINYEVKYSDGDNIELKDKLTYGEVETLLIRVEYKRDINDSDLINEDLDLDFSFEIEYVQDDGTGKNRKLLLGDVFGNNILDGSSLVLNKKLEKGEVGIYNLNNVTFFRGHELNNNVIIDNTCYKVLTKSDGVVKLLYNGLAVDNKCGLSDYHIGLSVYNSDSSSDDYLTSDVRTNLLSWYNDKLKKYDNYLVSGYCSDTSKEGNVYNADKRFVYGTVDFNCQNTIDDKVGLLTIDDVMLIGYGMNGGVANNNEYLEEYYLMSPQDITNNKVNQFCITNVGDVHSMIVTFEKVIRPVIKLNDNIRISDGLGTLNNPYIINLSI